MILTRIKVYPQERLDLEDVTALLSSARTDEKLYTKEFLSSSNYILKGFSITGLGLKAATMSMTSSTLIIGGGTSDFSYFIAPPGAANIVIPDADIVDGVRNYVELQLSTLDGTPITKAFWDPSANGGLGAEFNQTVNTMTDLKITPVVVQGGFTGSPDRVQVAILDTDGSGNIKTILDRRELFRRLGKPENINFDYSWSSQQEPPYSLNMTSESGTFVTGETINIGSETAVVVTGGTTSITFRTPTGINFFPGDSVIGGTSGATGTVDTVVESFTGADKSIANQKEELDAVKSQIKAITGNDFWHQVPALSLADVNNFDIVDLEKHLSQLRLVEHPVNKKRVKVTGLSSALMDGTRLNQPVTKTLLDFDGAEIDFSTGIIYKSDGTTPVGPAFTPFSIPSSKYFWYSVTLVFGSLNADNTVVPYFTVTPAASANASISAAPKAVFVNGIPLGQVEVRQSGSDIASITQSNIIQLAISVDSSGSGSGGEVKVNYFDPVSTTLPTGPTVTIDGVSGVNGDLVLYTNLGSGNNKVYKLGGVGTSITWTPQSVFNDIATPTNGDVVRITNGVAFSNQLAEFNGTNFTVNDIVRYFNGADFWEQTSLKTTSIANSTTDTIFSVASAGSENFILSYSIVRGAAKQTGQIYVTSDGTTVQVSRVGSAIADCGVEFQASISVGVLTLEYISDASGSTGSMKYFLQRWSDSSGGPTGVPSYSGGGGSPVPASGNIYDVQFKGSSGNLDADDNFKWDPTNVAIDLNGLKLGILNGPVTILDAQASPTTLLTINGSTFKHVIIEYSIERDGLLRTGRILLTGIDTGLNVGFSDDFVESSSVGISFTTTVSGPNILLQYTSTATSFNGTFKYAVRQWN